MTTFAVIADAHIDSSVNTVFNSDEGLLDNTVEALRCLTHVVTYCNKHHIDFLVSAGDFFDNGVTHHEVIRRTIDVFNQLESTKVIFVAGNHEYKGLKKGQNLPYSLFPDYPWCQQVVWRDETMQLSDCFVGFLPWEKVVGEASSTPSTFSQRAMDLLPSDTTTPTLLFGHALITGSLTPYTRRDGTPRLVDDAFGDGNNAADVSDTFTGWDYVGLGHIHRRQMIPGTPLHYVGKLYRVSRDDMVAPVGFEVVTVEGTSVSFTHQTIPGERTIATINLENIETATTDDNQWTIISIPVGHELSSDEQKSLSRLKHEGRKVTIDYVPSKESQDLLVQVEKAVMTDGLSPYDSMRKWCKSFRMDDDDIDHMVSTFRTYLEDDA